MLPSIKMWGIISAMVLFYLLLNSKLSLFILLCESAQRKGSHHLVCFHSQILLSRAPLTRENQLVALAAWTPNFRDMPLATAHMTDPVTHICWSEQISPLAFSSQATWQAFNLSHCIEMHNTHSLSRAGQLSQTYFIHSAPILAPRNQPLTVNKQWLPLQESRMSRHTRFNPAEKGNRHDAWYISWYKYSSKVDTTIDPNPILYFYYAENVKNLSYLKYDLRICHREIHATLVKPGCACATTFLIPNKPRRGLADFNTESIMCCLTQRMIWQFCCIIIKI